MKDKYGIDDTTITDDIGIRCDIVDMMPYMEDQARSASVILELGCQYGNGSTKALTWGLRKSEVDENNKCMISIDITNQITSYRVPQDIWWNFVLGDSKEPETIDQVKSILGDKKIDLLFIDSDHTPEQVVAELDAYLPMCTPNVLVILHDTAEGVEYAFPGYSQAIKDYATTNEFMYQVISNHGQGLSVIQKKYHP